MQASQAQPAEDASAEPGDRLAALEKAIGLNRLLLLVVAGLILTMLASWLTLGILQYGSEQVSEPDPALLELNRQFDAQSARLQALEERLAQQQTLLDGLAGQLQARALPQTAGSADESALRQQIARTLIGQEEALQQTLAALKLGMQDLAGMISGSRSWLEDYREALDRPLVQSRARIKELQQWSATPESAEPAAERAP